MRLAGCQVTGGRCEKIDPVGEQVQLRPEAETMNATLSFGAAQE
jgi:hypothetical protein